ncbi:hypothetical protein F0344_21630 [Streptomyces finlayi]|uniref:C2H2-type domain-containing protein n=1 Tax=Streptomyces finlayi TaxID=67296 RepID=A0A7G7BNF3_9ACTN|nr:hypothetical protein [Streptomyces finlayi]QNE76868.1 hypothetical protein F0344_21630 [Streptomyces finlayi]
MSEIAATTVHEAYAFACMRCGYGWEQAYEIEHHVDGSGHEFVVYKADGQRVPSPLSTPTCANCGAHVVRIMRAGRVSTVQHLLENESPERTASAPAPVAASVASGSASGTTPGSMPGSTPGPSTGSSTEPEHHWRFSHLLHPFHRR